MALHSQGKKRRPTVINEQVLANKLEVGLLIKSPVPWGLSQGRAEPQVLGNSSQPS